MRHLLTLELIEQVAQAGSIRQAAEDMNITSSALNRRIQAFEEELGTPIFERLPRGVRLNPAGELLVQHIRAQRADLARVRSQIADLSGVRRGHVSIVCSQALTPFFLPAQIAAYRAQHPGVDFTVRVRDRSAAERELSNFSADLALVFEPVYLADFEILYSVRQPVYAVMKADHPLAERPVLRLRDCLDWPHVVPTAPYGVRHLLDLALRNASRRLEPVVECDSFEFMRRYVLHENAVSFQISVGLIGAQVQGMAFRPLPEKDIPMGHLMLGQLRGRTLPVASAKFAQVLVEGMEELARTTLPSPDQS